jgi:hypothetical protein
MLDLRFSHLPVVRHMQSQSQEQLNVTFEYKWEKTDSLILLQGLSCQDLECMPLQLLSPPEAQASSGLLLRPQQPDADEDDYSINYGKLAWKVWMKESITVPEDISCDVLNWWKMNAACFPLIAKVAKIVLATPEPEAILRVSFQAGQAH